MGWVMGFEPTNTGTTIRGLRPLGDTHHIKFAETVRCAKKWHARRDSIVESSMRCVKSGTPEGTRTPDLLLRRQLLYPAELLAHVEWSG